MSSPQSVEASLWSCNRMYIPIYHSLADLELSATSTTPTVADFHLECGQIDNATLQVMLDDRFSSMRKKWKRDTSIISKRYGPRAGRCRHTTALRRLGILDFGKFSAKCQANVYLSQECPSLAGRSQKSVESADTVGMLQMLQCDATCQILARVAVQTGSGILILSPLRSESLTSMSPWPAWPWPRDLLPPFFQISIHFRLNNYII